MGKRKLEQAEQVPEQEEKQAVSEDAANSDEGDSDITSDSGSDEEGSSDSSSGDDGSSSGPEVSDDEKEASDDPDAFDKIDVNFEFYDPKESDFHGLKALLHSYLDGQQYDSSPLVDAIIEQVC
jgi:protein BCP1